MKKIEISKNTLVLIILGCLLIGGFIGATISYTKSRWIWIKKSKDWKRTITIRAGHWEEKEFKTFWDFLWTAMWRIFWLTFWGIVLFKIIKWMLS